MFILVLDYNNNFNVNAKKLICCMSCPDSYSVSYRIINPIFRDPMTKSVKNGCNTKTPTTTKASVEVSFKPKSEKRLKKELHRQQRALEELDTLGPISKLIVLTARVRTPANHPNAAYVQAVRRTRRDILPSGGFCKGSSYHYERGF